MAETKSGVTFKWYVLRTISGKELKVKEMIEAACNNVPELKQNIEQVLVPTEVVYTMRGGKKVPKERVMFSGYAYVKARLVSHVESFLQNTSNVIDFLRSREVDKRAVVVPESQIQHMLGAAQEREAAIAEQMNGYMVGESVKVNFGPFNGFVGEIREVNPERDELTVMVMVFGRETPLRLDSSQVERV